MPNYFNENQGEGITFIKRKGDVFYKKATEGEQGAIKNMDRAYSFTNRRNEWKENDKLNGFIIPFSSVTGSIDHVRIKDSDFDGKKYTQLNVCIIELDGTKIIISINKDNSDYVTICKFLFLAKKSDIYTIKPYSFRDDNAKEISGIVFYNGKEVNKEQRIDLKNAPSPDLNNLFKQLENEKDADDRAKLIKDIVYEQRKFIKSNLLDVIFEKFKQQNEDSNETITTNEQPESEFNAADDDLPF